MPIADRGPLRLVGAASLVALHHRTDERLPDESTRLLGWKSGLPAESARDECLVERGRPYVAAGDHHVLVENGIVRVHNSPWENRFRPAIECSSGARP